MKYVTDLGLEDGSGVISVPKHVAAGTQHPADL